MLAALIQTFKLLPRPHFGVAEGGIGLRQFSRRLQLFARFVALPGANESQA